MTLFRIAKFLLICKAIQIAHRSNQGFCDAEVVYCSEVMVRNLVNSLFYTRSLIQGGISPLAIKQSRLIIRRCIEQTLMWIFQLVGLHNSNSYLLLRIKSTYS